MAFTLNRMQQKVLLFLVILILPIFLYGAAMADGVWEFESSIDGMTSYQDGVMFSEGNRIWFWTPELEAPQKVDEGSWISLLFTDGSQLFALSEGDGNAKVFRCAVNDQKLSKTEECTLKWPDPENCFAINAFCQQNVVFVVLTNRNNGSYTLLAYDIKSQQEWIWENCPAQHISSYQGNLLLGSRYNNQNSTGGAFELVSVDVAAKQITTISSLPGLIGSLTYSSQNDQIAYLLSPIVYTGPISGTQTEQGYLPVASLSTDMGVLIGNDVYALADSNRLLVTRLDPAFSQNNSRFLTIAENGMDSNITRLFRMDNPGIPVISRDAALSPADVAQAIRGNDTNTDIFVIRTSDPGYKSLLSKGFCTDLSFDDNLKTLVSTIPEELAKGLMCEGKLMAFPLNISFSNSLALSYSPEALATIGVEENSLPHNLSDLLSKVIEWYESGVMDDVRLFSTYSSEYTLVNFVLRHYTEYYEATQDEPLDYKGELFCELMEKTDQIIKLMKKHPLASNSLPGLFMPDSPVSQFKEYDTDTSRVLLPLTPKEGMPQRYTTEMMVCIVNPLSTKLPQAVLYLLSAAKNMDCIFRLFIWPSTTVPIERPSYAKAHQEMEEMIAQAKKDKLRAPAENLKELSTILEQYQRDLAVTEQNRWKLSQETIDAYKKYAPYIYLTSDFVWTMIDFNQSDAILNRYLTGNMGWREMVQSLEDRYLMIQEEQSF